MSPLRAFERLRPSFRVAGVSALLGAILFADLVTGSDITLRALYLAPIALAAWTLSGRAGVVMSLLSVGVSLYFDIEVIDPATHRNYVYIDAIVRLIVYLGASSVLRRLRDASTRLEGLAETDFLTGLYNRRGFERAGARELEVARREQSPLSVMEIDLDGFKAVNDALGHHAGDEVLIAVAHALASGRASDIAARLGGDEFALLLPRTSAEVVAKVVERVVGRMNEAMRRGGWNVTFSVGVASYPNAPASLDAMIAVADALMYDAKGSGKHAVRYRAVAEPT